MHGAGFAALSLTWLGARDKLGGGSGTGVGLDKELAEIKMVTESNCGWIGESISGRGVGQDNMVTLHWVHFKMWRSG